MENDLYSDYVRREPHPRNAVFIQRWHGRLLKLALKISKNSSSKVLEIGPGHGYFANECTKQGLDYEFCDTSAAVVEKMTALGHTGHLGLLHDISGQLTKYDLIWMSHVLEHSPSWLEARRLIDDAKSLLNPGGMIVVVSPDALNWRREFWNVDWSHGYPTTIRNVSQLFSDVGLSRVLGVHHRNASKSIVVRAVFSILAKSPHQIIDRVLTPQRARLGDGFLYSWKAVFGWRQIMVIGYQGN